ncbi:uncharacterized protein TNCV_520241 [Trichonephila clavipes]|nr:uncharacterized protein TNCV_520241 [Trichonephila clavipes]
MLWERVVRLVPDPEFFNEVLCSDECRFSKQGTINTQNKHYCSLENPHLIRPNRHQARRLVNVCCKIWKSTLIRTIYFDGPLISESYSGILSGPLANFLEDEVSLRDLSRMWYQHDGAPKRKSAQPCTFLAHTFDTQIIGYGGQQEWPPRSSNRSPLNFLLRGCLKRRKVYERESTSKSDSLNRISMA